MKAHRTEQKLANIGPLKISYKLYIDTTQNLNLLIKLVFRANLN